MKSNLAYLQQKILNDSLILGEDFEGFLTYRFDNRQLFLSSSPDVLTICAEELWEKIKDTGVDVLFTKGTTALPLVTAIRSIAFTNGKTLDVLFIRSERKTYGAKNLIEGAPPHKIAQKNAIFVDDLINAGNTFTQACKELVEEDYQLKVLGIACVIDLWQFPGSRKLSALGFKIFSLFRRHDLGITREDSHLPAIVKKINWRTNEFHNGPNLLKWKGAPVVHENYLLIGNDNGHHYCYDKDTGNLLWVNKSVNPQGKGDASVSQIYNGLVYWSSYDGTIKCCHIDTGQPQWVTKATEYLHSSPCLDPPNDRLFIGTEWKKVLLRLGGFGLGDIICVKMSTGEILWSYPTNGMIPCTPVYSSNLDIVCCGSNDFHFYLLTGSGALVKKIPTRGEPKGRPVLNDDQTVVFFVTVQGYAYAVSLETGKIIWCRRIGVKAQHPYPIVYDNLLVASNAAGMISCLNQQTGELEWVCHCRAELGWGPVLYKNYLIGITEQGQCHLIDKYNGKKLSNDKLKFLIGEQLTVCQPPAIDNNTVYLVSNDAGILCFEIDDGILEQ